MSVCYYCGDPAITTDGYGEAVCEDCETYEGETDDTSDETEYFERLARDLEGE